MSKYNEAELHAIKALDPPGYLRWQLPGLDPDLEWDRWLETQVAPPAGLPFLRCDCVAGLRSRSGTQPPWACLIEAQAQPLPRLAVWMVVYLGLLHEDLRHGPHDRDRFLMLGAILNLTDGPLTNALDWLPPLQPSTSPPPGVQCRFWARNVREESAEDTLEQIAAGELALCILVWVALMKGGDRPEVVRRWQELALRQEEAHLRADYVALTLVFAELAGRETLWAAALKEFDVQDSRIAQQWEDKGLHRGLQQGLAKGTLVGKVQLCQELLQLPLTSEQELLALPEPDLTALLIQLREQIRSTGN